MDCTLKFILFQVFSLILSSQSYQLQLFDKSETTNTINEALTPELQQCVKVVISEENKDSYTGNLLPDDKFVITYSKLVRNRTRTLVPSEAVQLRGIYRLRNLCTVAITQVSNQVTSSSLIIEALYTFLLSLDGIIRNNKDHFIFYSISANYISDRVSYPILRSIFASGSIASYVKNKVGLQISLQNTQPQTFKILTTCFYCGTNNTPKLLETDYITTLSTINFPDYLTNFNGKVFTVSVATLCSWNIAIQPIPEKPGKYKAIRGIYKFNFDHLSKKFNFSGTFFPSTGGGGTGNRYSNGTWAGAVGDVYNGKADLGGPVGLVLSRSLVVNFAFPVTYDRLVFTTGMPQPNYSWKSIYWPLDSLVWYHTIAFAFLTSAVFLFILKISRNKSLSNIRVIRYLLALFLEQDDGKMNITDNASRVLLSFWLIFCILVTTAYKSKLVSLISFPILEDPPKSFKSLAQTSPNDYQITLQYLRGAAFAVLRTSKNPTFKNIFSRMQLEENDAKCFQKSVGTVKHACISWAYMAMYVKNKNLSDTSGYAPLVMAPDTSTFIAASFVFRKDEVFKEKFDQVISEATDMGLKEKWIELDNEWVRNERYKWEKKENIKRVVYEERGGGSIALKLENLLGTFFVLLGGLVIGVLAALCEIIGYKLISFNVASVT